MSADLTSESSGDFIIYIGSGRDRPGSVREHAAARNLTVVMVDKKVGGYTSTTLRMRRWPPR